METQLTAPREKFLGSLQETHPAKDSVRGEVQCFDGPIEHLELIRGHSSPESIHQSRVIFNISNVAWQHSQCATFLQFLGLTEIVS